MESGGVKMRAQCTKNPPEQAEAEAEAGGTGAEAATAGLGTLREKGHRKMPAGVAGGYPGGGAVAWKGGSPPKHRCHQRGAGVKDRRLGTTLKCLLQRKEPTLSITL